MLIKTASFLQSAAETLFSLNANSQLKNDIERYRDAKAREHGYKVLFAKQRETISKQEETISEQAKENARLKSLLAKHGISEE